MVKGDALYSIGCFEHSLVNYHRALEFVSSKEKGKLVNRISRTELAIVNSVGINNPSCFDDVAGFLANCGANGSLSARDKGTDRALLSELAVDKMYLENLLDQLSKNRGSKCMRRATTETRSAISFLQERTEFWIQNAPKIEKKSMYRVN
ncbi:uncharacterized protein LOC131892784 [Tigriopus californicus]|nr:uncharacterized protein LOC131892784 [Tigriopus californicus]